MHAHSMAEATGHPPVHGESREEPKRDHALRVLAEKLSVSPEVAEKLYASGLKTADAAHSAPTEALTAAGLSEEDIAKVHSNVVVDAASPDARLEQWLETKARTSRKGASHRKGRARTTESDELFQRWVAGDDSAFAPWLQPEKPAPPETPATTPEPAPAPAETPPSPASPTAPGEPAAEAPKAPEPTSGPAPVAPPAAPAEGTAPPEAPAVALPGEESERKLAGWVDGLSNRIGAPGTDMEALLKEGRQMAQEYQALIRRNREMDEELAHVKKGSVAVIKFVRSKEARLREEAIAAKEEEMQGLRARIADLESSSPSGGAKPEGAAEGKGSWSSDKSSPAALAPMVEALKSKERLLKAREEELTAKLDEVRVRSEEFERKKGPLAMREEQIVKWEEEVKLREAELKSKILKYEADQKALQDPEILEKLKHLADLDGEIAHRESEVKAREEFLTRKLEELQGKEKEVVDAEIAHAEEEIKVERTSERARTGVARLDDLLYGGLPLGCNVLINGGKHTGKEVLAKFLAAEGLKKGVPVLWILTDTDPAMVREEMSLILKTYDEYERRGLVRYIDLYSLTLGTAKPEPNVTLIQIQDATALAELAKAVDAVSADFLKISRYYRLVFQSLSTVTAYLDTRQTLAFLQAFTGRRLREKVVAYYLLETGMHQEGDIEMLEHVMSGSFSLKVESLKTFLSVKGVVDDVQSRAWVNYNFTRSVFSMGSFSLDHIR